MTSIISTAKQVPSIVSMGVKVFVVSSTPHRSGDSASQAMQGISQRGQEIVRTRVYGKIVASLKAVP